MKNLSGFNTQEIRRLHPYLSSLSRRVKDLEKKGRAGQKVDWGEDEDVQPTGNANLAGTLNKYARVDHQHLFKIPTAIPSSTPDGTAFFDPTASAINIYIGNTPTTKIVAGGDEEDVQPTGTVRTGTAPRYSYADHSHPTALLPQSDLQTPVENEIRFNTDDKIVRWNGSEWVEMSVEQIEKGRNIDVQPTRLRNAGSSSRLARADHSHPTAILPQIDSQTPVADEIRYTENNKIVRWNGNNWVELSVETFTINWANSSDVAPTGVQSTGFLSRVARADHSHPTAILPQNNSQVPVIDEIRYTTANRLVRWNGSAWVNFAGGLPVPADPLILPYDTEVSSPQNRQLVNRTAWDNIGNATVFYRDVNNGQYRLIFARPLITCTTNTLSGKDVWTDTADELVLKEGTGFYRGAVLWRRRGNTQDWSPVSVQLLDNGVSYPTDVGVLTRSPLTGTSGSRRWFLRGAQEGGSFRAPFAGIATFTASTVPAIANLATNLEDGYAYYFQDLERVDIVRPISGGAQYCTMLPHYVIAPTGRILGTGTESSGHYVGEELWNGMIVIRYYTTTSATSDLYAIYPTFAVPYGIQAGRVILYLYNPQSSAISTVFAVAVRRPTSTTPITSATSNTTISIPANTGIVADLGVITFPPSNTLSHHRSHLLAVNIIRRKSQEAPNANSVMCFGVVIVPERT